MISFTAINNWLECSVLFKASLLHLSLRRNILLEQTSTPLNGRVLRDLISGLSPYLSCDYGDTLLFGDP
jgi:hypothetical protein